MTDTEIRTPAEVAIDDNFWTMSIHDLDGIIDRLEARVKTFCESQGTPRERGNELREALTITRAVRNQILAENYDANRKGKGSGRAMTDDMVTGSTIRVFDSRPDTYEHIGVVRRLLGQVVKDLLDRADGHDASKLVDPERTMFDEYTPKLKHSTYGSDEYKGFLVGMGDALQHHYANNRHHPEHHEDGILGMTLIDLVEMACDWIAASQRHADGDPRRSIELNQERFGYDDQIKRILLNTVDALEPRAEPACPDVDVVTSDICIRLGGLLGMGEDLVRNGIQLNGEEVVLEDLIALLRGSLPSTD